MRELRAGAGDRGSAEGGGSAEGSMQTVEYILQWTLRFSSHHDGRGLSLRGYGCKLPRSLPRSYVAGCAASHDNLQL